MFATFVVRARLVWTVRLKRRAADMPCEQAAVDSRVVHLGQTAHAYLSIISCLPIAYPGVLTRSSSMCPQDAVGTIAVHRTRSCR